MSQNAEGKMSISRRNQGAGGKLGLIALLFIVSIAIAVGATLFFSKDSGNSTTISVDQVRELAVLATAEAKVTLVKEEVDYKVFGNDIPFGLESIPGTKRKILLVIPATVLAGVDLEKVASDDFNVDEEKKELDITLPRATFIQEPALLMDEVKTYSERGLISGEVDWNEGYELAAIAQNELKEEAINLGILEKAEQSAEKALQSFFKNLGYTVKVTFK